MDAPGVMDRLKKAYARKTVLVTGDTGFKGSWLSIWLHMLGARVVGFAFPPRTDEDNYVVCGLGGRNEHIDGDIRDFDVFHKVMTDIRPSIVFHLAAQALVLDSYKDPLGTFQTNVLGTANVLEAVRGTSGVQAAVMVASDKCYENRERARGYKETDPLGGRDPYSASKGASEIVTSSYIRSFFGDSGSACIASVRAGNVIGGGDWSPNRIMPDCIRALRRSEPVTVRNPDAVRPWQHVLEPLHGYLYLGALLMKGKRSYSGAWNFGPSPSNRYPVRRLVEEVIRAWGQGRYRVRRDRGAKEARMLALDISKAARQLGWRPALRFPDTVRFTVEEYRFRGGDPDDFFAQRAGQIDRYQKIRKAMEVCRNE
jgi:CDP-glucose 4,6-dehydratase